MKEKNENKSFRQEMKENVIGFGWGMKLGWQTDQACLLVWILLSFAGAFLPAGLLALTKRIVDTIADHAEKQVEFSNTLLLVVFAALSYMDNHRKK